MTDPVAEAAQRIRAYLRERKARTHYANDLTTAGRIHKYAGDEGLLELWVQDIEVLLDFRDAVARKQPHRP